MVSALFRWAGCWGLILCAVSGMPGCGGGAAGGNAAGVAYTLQLLHVSDAIQDDETVLASLPNLAGMVNRFKADYPDNTLVVSAGNNAQPSPRYYASADPEMSALLGIAGGGRADIAVLNALGVQASAMGNHEFDLGTAQLAKAIQSETSSSGARWEGAQFPHLAYNTDFSQDSDTRPLQAANGQDASSLTGGKLTGWTRVRLGSETIGVIAVSSPTIQNMTSTGTLSFLPKLTNSGSVDVPALAALVQRGINEITGQGINKVVLLARMDDFTTVSNLTSKLKDVDIVVMGATKAPLADSNDVLRAGDSALASYPILTKDAAGQPVAMVATTSDDKYLGRFMAPFDSRGVLVPSAFNTALSGAWQTASPGTSLLPDRLVQAIVDALQGLLNKKDAVVYGWTDVYLEGRPEIIRTQDTNLGQLSTDAFLWYARLHDPGIQLAMWNSGALGASIGEVFTDPVNAQVSLKSPQANRQHAAGAITQLDIETVLLFHDNLWAFDVTAGQLKALFEHGVAVFNADGRFPQVSGATFAFDADQQAQTLNADGSIQMPGQRIRSLVVGNEVVVQNGSLKVDPARTFRMLSNNFMAAGGDGYPFPVNLSNKLELDRAMSNATAGGPPSIATTALGKDRDALGKYLQQYYSSNRYSTPNYQVTRRITNLTQANLIKSGTFFGSENSTGLTPPSSFTDMLPD